LGIVHRYISSYKSEGATTWTLTNSTRPNHIVCEQRMQTNEPSIRKPCLNQCEEYQLRNLTLSGYDCAYWNDESVHNHLHLNEINSNFCQNPGSFPEGPWCYTTDPNKVWDNCFTMCSKN